MARLIEAGEDPRPVVERMLTRSAVLTGAIMCALVGSTPALIPAVFAPEWHSIVNILPWACAGLLVGGPVSVAVAGFLFAKGDAATVLRGAVLQTCASLVFGLALLPVMGVTALGMSVFASAVVEGIVLGARASREYEIRIVKPLVIPTLMSVIAGTIGWITAEHVAPVALGAVAEGTRGPRRLCPGRMGTESTCAQRHCQYGDAISSIGGRLMCLARTCLRRAGRRPQ